MKRLAIALLLPAALALPAAGQGSIEVGQTVTGRLTSGSPTLDDGSHYELFRLRLREGQRVAVTLRSDDFDAYLAVGRFADVECQEDCETDDDGAGGRDARLTYRAERSGTFTIRVNTLSEGETGDYTLTVAEEADRGNGLRGAIQAGETVSGSLDERDPTAGDGSYFEMWTFRAPFSGVVRLVMESEDFDAYLSLGSGLGEDWEEIDSDDDSAGGTDAALEVEVEAGETYRIRANALSEGETGRYTLRVERS